MVVEIYRKSVPKRASLELSAGGRYLDLEELLASRHTIAGYECQGLVGSSRGLRGVLNQIYDAWMGDLLTQVERKTPVIHILLNNQSLDFVSIEQQEAGYIPYGVGFKNPNFAAVAEAIGAKGVQVFGNDHAVAFAGSQATFS